MQFRHQTEYKQAIEAITQRDLLVPHCSAVRLQASIYSMNETPFKG